MTRRGWLLFLGLSVMWGMTYLLIKVALRDLDPATLVFLRCTLAALILLPWAALTGRLSSLRGHLWWIAAFALCECGIPWLLMCTAEQHISSSLTALLVAGVPMLGAIIFQVTHPHERLGRARWMGLLIGTLGVGLLVGLSVNGTTATALAMMVLVVLGYTIGPIIIATKLAHLQGGGVVAVSVALLALLYAPWGTTHLPDHLGAASAWAVVTLAVVCTAVSFLAFFALVVEVGAPRATVVTYVNPAVAVAAGTIFLSETLTPAMLLGFPLVIVGSVLATGRGAPSTESA
jgi:drug/metabolite transporter (DMT)-like permease